MPTVRSLDHLAIRQGVPDIIAIIMRGNRQVRRKLRSDMFVRSADGHVRVDREGETELADIWAEQRRLRLKEAIERDKKKAERKQQFRQLLKRLTRGASAVPQGTKESAGSSKTIEISIRVPRTSFRKLTRRFKKIPSRLISSKKRWIILSTVSLVLIVSVGVMMARNGETHNKDDATRTTGGVVAGKTVQTPNFQTVLPVGKSIQELGGWARVSPPEKEPVFAYADMIDGTRILVSQQPLPETFKKSPGTELTKLAEQFLANETITVNDSVVYIGTSEKGPQSVLLTAHDLLILVRADTKIANEQWVSYLASLQ
jgi:hypothetical protein